MESTGSEAEGVLVDDDCNTAFAASLRPTGKNLVSVWVNAKDGSGAACLIPSMVTYNSNLESRANMITF